MKIRINLNGQSVDAETVEFKALDEPWAQYKLEDGTIVKIKLVVSDIFRLPANDPLTGLPQIAVKSTNIMSVEPPRIKEDMN